MNPQPPASSSSSDPSAPGEIVTAVGRTTARPLTQQTAYEAVEALAGIARDVIGSAEGAGVSIMDINRRRQSVGATDVNVRTADAVQYELRQGPCISAWSSREPVYVADTRTDQRWPAWAVAVEPLGIRSCLSVPLLGDVAGLGAMKVYSSTVDAFSPEDRRLLVSIARSAAALLGHVQAGDAQQRLGEAAAAALAGRETIGIARGVLMERFNLDRQAAMDSLIYLATSANTTIGFIADMISERTDSPQSPASAASSHQLDGSDVTDNGHNSDPADDTYGHLQPGTPSHTAAYLQNLVLDSPDVQSFLDNLARVAVKHLAGHGYDIFCGVTLLRPSHAATIASSNPQAQRLDELQYSYGDGPCLTAARTNQPMLVDDTRTRTRWPEYLADVTKHGVASIFGVPIPLDGDMQCALNLYSTSAGSFDVAARRTAEFFASEASVSLRLAVRIASLTETAGHLNATLQSRTTIDLAAGMIMAQNRCTQEDAITILKNASSHRQVKVRDLAEQLVATVNHQPPVTHFD